MRENVYEQRSLSDRQPLWVRQIEALAVSAAMIWGASVISDEESSSKIRSEIATDVLSPPEREAAPTTSATISEEIVMPPPTGAPVVCEGISWEVSLGSHYAEQNVEEIQEQLSSLYRLLWGPDDLSFQQVLNVGEVIRDAREDPLYAQALTQILYSLAHGENLSADFLLSIPEVDQVALCEDGQLSRPDFEQHLEDVVIIGGTLLSAVGEQLGPDDPLLQGVFDTVEAQFDEFVALLDEIN